MSASRGYCGYHKGMYLRSMREYAYALYLDNLNVMYDTEVKTYEYNGETFKPDFFIYDINNNIHTITEIKYHISQYNKKEDWFNYFKSIGINYNIVIINNIDKFIKKYNIDKNLISKFKLNCIYDYTGKNNPRYGQHCSEETKYKIVNNRDQDNFRQKAKLNGDLRRGIKNPNHSEKMKLMYLDPENRSKTSQAILNGKKIPYEIRRLNGLKSFQDLKNSDLYESYISLHQNNTENLWKKEDYRNKIKNTRSQNKYSKGLVSFINKYSSNVGDINYLIDQIYLNNEEFILNLKRTINFTNARFKCKTIIEEFPDKDSLIKFVYNKIKI